MGGQKRQCKAIKAGGGRCKKPALDQQDFCWSHHSGSAQARKEIATAGGKARRSPDELEAIKSQLRTIAGAVLRGEMDRSAAVVVNQVYNSILRTVELQRRLDAQAELEDRLRLLEDEVERKGIAAWTPRRG